MQTVIYSAKIIAKKYELLLNLNSKVFYEFSERTNISQVDLLYKIRTYLYSIYNPFACARAYFLAGLDNERTPDIVVFYSSNVLSPCTNII